MKWILILVGTFFNVLIFSDIQKEIKPLSLDSCSLLFCSDIEVAIKDTVPNKPFEYIRLQQSFHEDSLNDNSPNIFTRTKELLFFDEQSMDLKKIIDIYKLTPFLDYGFKLEHTENEYYSILKSDNPKSKEEMKLFLPGYLYEGLSEDWHCEEGYMSSEVYGLDYGFKDFVVVVFAVEWNVVEYENLLGGPLGCTLFFVYNKNGELLHFFKKNENKANFTLTSDGNFLGIVYNRFEKDYEDKIVEIIAEIISLKDSSVLWRKSMPQSLIEGIEPSAMFDVFGEDYFVYYESIRLRKTGQFVNDVAVFDLANNLYHTIKPEFVDDLLVKFLSLEKDTLNVLRHDSYGTEDLFHKNHDGVHFLYFPDITITQKIKP